jgi:AraC family transcriptional regulator
MTSTYDSIPPHVGATVTEPGQVGVSFSDHESVVYETDNRIRRASYLGGSVVVSGQSPIVWWDVRQPTEALEIYPDDALFTAVDGSGNGRCWPLDRCIVGVSDPVVLGVASTLRRAHVDDRYLSDVAASALAVLLAQHVLAEYGADRPGHTRASVPLRNAALRRVAELVDSRLQHTLTLSDLAAVAHLSPYHFARSFRTAVGMPPHAYVTSRRIDRARHLLRSTRTPVEQVASAVGFANLSHFRRVFRTHVGAAPSAYRDAWRAEPMFTENRPGSRPV